MSPTPLLAAAPALSGVAVDHVAIAVADIAAALRWWQDLGATPVAGWTGADFTTEQVRLSNAGKVELISRKGDQGFIGPFLDRYGSGRIHHVTLTVPGPLTDAVQHLRQAGLDVVDVDTDDPEWHEGFLRPSQAGGLIVQVAWARDDDESVSMSQGRGPLVPPDPSAPPLRRVVLGHPDLTRAAALWRVLGADVDELGGTLVVRWEGSPIQLEVHAAEVAGPIGLVLDGRAADATDVSPALMPTDV